MTYIISDLHGYPLEKFKKLLAKAGFGEDDYLYILGDVIDRNGDGGIEMLQWLMYQYNIQMLLGNHAGLGNFAPDKAIEDYTADDLIWHRPSINERYYEDVYTIFGHTPTLLFGEEYTGKIIKTDTWACIDTGVGYDNEPILLRLDDFKEFKL